MTAPRTTIYLVARAPVDMTYQHTISFKSPEEQLTFWGSLSRYELREYQYARRDRRFITVEKTFDELEGINYLFYRTSDLSKWIYCFVTDREYVNDVTTRIYFEIDVLQTYQFDMELKPSFVTQSHVDRWDANHNPIFSITDEGLNYGSEYVTESAFRVVPAPTVADISTVENANLYRHGFYLILCAPHHSMIVSGDASEPTKIFNAPTPYVMYLLFSDERYGLRPVNTMTYSDGEHTVSMPVTSLSAFQNFMAKSAFGEFVKQIVYLPYFPFPYSWSAEAQDVNIVSNYIKCRSTTISAKNEEGTITAGVTLCKIDTINDHFDFLERGNNFRELASMPFTGGIELAMPSEEMFAAIKKNPRKTEYDRRFQSKLLCYPYRYNVFTDWQGAPALIKNEYLGDENITIYGSIAFAFNAPRRFWVANYRGDPEGRESGINQPLPLEQPVINDAYYTYLLQNKNQISANITNAAINAAAGAVSGAVSGAATGGVGGAIAGGLMSGISGALSVQAGIRSENAKQADIKNLPDTITVSNDCSFALTDDAKYLTFYRKKICCEYEEQLAQYWHMYGYKVNRLEIPRIKSRVRFNFIKTIGANITGPIENNFLTTIKQIFDNGVTFWHYSATDFYPLDYSYENPEVSLI